VTLLAVLELVRQGRIRAQQTELFGEIVLERSTVTAEQPLTSTSDTSVSMGAPDADAH